METHYDATAEFHEVHVIDAWSRLRDVVNGTFGDVGPDGVIVDIGAGSGVGSAVLAGCTDAEIFALEPNPTMRAMLMARLDNVLDRVTVVPRAVPDGLEGLPGQVDGVLAAHMLGHLTAADRTALLDWMGSTLAPGRSALLTVSGEVPTEGSEPVVQERKVGRHVYRVTHHMPGPGRYEGVFDVIDEQQRVVRSVPDAISWTSVTAADLRNELADHPVEVTEPLPGVAVVSKLAT